MKVFLTGGTGFIGQVLTKSLLRRGWSVTVLVRKPDSPRAQHLKSMGALLAAGDVTRRESMVDGMSGADLVIHNAGVYEFGVDKAGAQRMRAINVGGTDNVLSLASELDIPRTVHVSSVKAFGDSGPQSRDETYTRTVPCRTVYEQSKTDSHARAQYYQERGCPVIIACPHQVIGANDHSIFGYLIRAYLNGVMPPAAWGSDSVLCFVDVSDAAEGIALAAERGSNGDTYLICGEPQTLQQTLGYWNTKAGGSKTRVWLPGWLASLLVAPLEPVQRKLGIPAVLSRETVRAATTNWNYCGDKARRELGWNYRSAEAMWSDAMEQEMRLLAKRGNQSLVERLKPLETVD